MVIKFACEISHRIANTDNCDSSLLKQYVEAKCNHSPFLLHSESYIPVSNGYIIIPAKAASLDITCIDNLSTIQIETPSLIQASCKLMSINFELYLNSDKTMHQIFIIECISKCLPKKFCIFCVKTQVQTTPTFVTYQPKIPEEEPLNIKKPNWPIFLNYFSRLCRSLEECITLRDNVSLPYQPYQPVI